MKGLGGDGGGDFSGGLFHITNLAQGYGEEEGVVSKLCLVLSPYNSQFLHLWEFGENLSTKCVSSVFQCELCMECWW